MKLVPIKQAATQLTNFGRKGQTNTSYIRIATFKQDRCISASIQGDTVHVQARGYESSDTAFAVGSSEYRHAVKQLLKREFPRSTHAYLERR